VITFLQCKMLYYKVKKHYNFQSKMNNNHKSLTRIVCAYWRTFLCKRLHPRCKTYTIITKLIRDQRSHNIGGACEKIEILIQFIVAN